MILRKPVIRIQILVLIVISFSLSGNSQPIGKSLKTLPEIHISLTEQAICKKINEYRTKRGLKPIPLSGSLTYVAQMHVHDLAENYKVSQRCNLHSWSSKGNWSPCCYTENQKRAECMWNKPRELTNYPGEGYEIAYWTNEPLDPEAFAGKALEIWKRSTGHNSVIINSREWKRLEWKAMGAGYYQGYLVVWFGAEPDNDTKISSSGE